MSLERSLHPRDDGELAPLDVDLDHARCEAGRLDLGVDRRHLDVDRHAFGKASSRQARERRIGGRRHVEERRSRRVADGLRHDQHVRAVVEREVLDELLARRRVRLEREHATRPVVRGGHGVEADVGSHVHEAAVTEVPAYEVELAPVVEAEEEVALERFAQVELQTEPARKRRDRRPLGAHREDPAQPALPAEADAAEDRVEGTLQHRPKLT